MYRLRKRLLVVAALPTVALMGGCAGEQQIVDLLLAVISGVLPSVAV